MTRDPTLHYFDVTLNEIEADVTVGCDYEPAEARTWDHPGVPASLTVQECWLGEIDIAPALLQSCIDQLEASAAEKMTAQQRKDAESDMAERYYAAQESYL